MRKILNYGSLNIDYVYDVKHFVVAGETISSENLSINCGGKGLNQSIAASKAGADVYHAGKIGNNGIMLRQILEENCVNTDYISECDTPNGHAIIQLDPTGQNCILLYSGSNHCITEKEIDNCISHFDKDDYIILQNEINNISYIMEQSYKHGMKIVFNPSPITDQLKEYPLHLVSLFILNEIEGKELSSENTPELILSALHQKYPNADILLTLGYKGAIFYNGSLKISHGIYRTEVIDTTAAGDTLTGYFVAGIANGKNIETALTDASIASAIAISRPGAAPSIPTAAEVENCTLDYIG